LSYAPTVGVVPAGQFVIVTFSPTPGRTADANCEEHLSQVFAQQQ